RGRGGGRRPPPHSRIRRPSTRAPRPARRADASAGRLTTNHAANACLVVTDFQGGNVKHIFLALIAVEPHALGAMLNHCEDAEVYDRHERPAALEANRITLLELSHPLPPICEHHP